MDGRAHRRNLCLGDDRATGAMVKSLVQATRSSPPTIMRALSHFVRGSAKKVLPPAIVRRIQRLRGGTRQFPLGSVRFGDHRRLSPISRTFGFDRATPVDRYYIERFLAENAGDIRGRVLEIGDNAYTVRFGGARVERSDIMHVDATNPDATCPRRRRLYRAHPDASPRIRYARCSRNSPIDSGEWGRLGTGR
jgi:hypothetical protein